MNRNCEQLESAHPLSTLQLHKIYLPPRLRLRRRPSDGEFEVLARLYDAAVAAVGAHDERAVAVAAHPPANSIIPIIIVKVYQNVKGYCWLRGKMQNT